MRTYQEDYDKYFSKLNGVSVTDAIEMPENESSQIITEKKEKKLSRRTGRLRKNGDTAE
jgi:hypothetical protein